MKQSVEFSLMIAKFLESEGAALREGLDFAKEALMFAVNGTFYSCH